MAKYKTGKGLPCGWALLPGKSAEVYQFVFDKLVELVDSDGTVHQPQRLCLDFEAAVIKVLQAKFPRSTITCCYFHFRKNLWAKLQDLGLTILYNQSPQFQTLIHMIGALSYVPLERVVEYYEQVVLRIIEEKETKDQQQDKEDEEEEDEVDCSWEEWYDDISSYTDYVERTYIGKRSAVTTRNNNSVAPRRKPLFQHALWNQYDLMSSAEEMTTVDGTNNTVESFNAVTNRLLGQNSNIWLTIDTFISQEAETRRVLLSNMAGQDLTNNQGRKLKLQQAHSMLCNTVQRIDDVTPLVYLKAVARIINTDSE